MIIGYTTGVWDMFHVGHLRLLKNAKSLCDKLIVGVSTDDLVRETKGHKPIISYDHRREIVASFADVVVAQHSLDKVEAWRRIGFDILFVGDDHYKTKDWERYEEELNGIAEIVYFPHTPGVSSTIIRRLCDSI